MSFKKPWFCISKLPNKAGRLKRLLLVHPVASLVQLFVESRNSVDVVLYVLGSRSFNKRLAAVLSCLKCLDGVVESCGEVGNLCSYVRATAYENLANGALP